MMIRMVERGGGGLGSEKKRGGWDGGWIIPVAEQSIND